MSNLQLWLSQRLTDFKTNRAALLEAKWNRNYNAFKRIDNEGDDTRIEGEDWRSDSYVALTRQKCVSGASLIVDLMLQRGQFPFALKPGPYQDAKDKGAPPAEVANRLSQMKDMERLIRQQLGDCHATRQLQLNIMSGAIYGETFVKRRIIQVTRPAYSEENGVAERGRGAPVASPSWEHVSVWDIFRDLEVDDMQSGCGVFHRQFLSAHDLFQMQANRYIQKDELLAAIKESQTTQAVNTNTMAPGYREMSKRDRGIEVFEYWGRAPRSYVQEQLTGKESIEKDEFDQVEVTATMIGDRIVRFAEVTGKRPFYRCEWETSVDSIAGVSVADNVEDMQKAINQAVRKFEDNKTLSANVMWAIKERFIDSTKVKWRPGQYVRVTEDCDDVRMAIQQLLVQDVGATLMPYISLLRELADEDSLIPKLNQGFAIGGTQTAFETSQLIEKAGKYIASIIKHYDDMIEDVIEDFYDYNFYDESNTVGIGDYVVVATAYDSYQSKIMKAAALQQLLATVSQVPGLQQAFKITAIGRDLASVLDFDSDKYVKSDEELQKEQEAQQQSVEFQVQQKMMMLQVEKLEAEIAKIKADTANAIDTTTTDIQAKGHELAERSAESAGSGPGAGAGATGDQSVGAGAAPVPGSGGPGPAQVAA